MDINTKAIIFATVAHDGQRRMFTAEPYVCHAIRVGYSCQHFLGYLHDTIEDSPARIVDNYLVLPGKPQAGTILLDRIEQDTLLALSRKDDETYEDFIRRVVDCGPLAVKIKVADIQDNLRNLPDGHRHQSRYANALQDLGHAIATR